MVDWLKGKGFGGSNEIDHLTKTINEQSDDQRKIITQFNKAMNEFATERSLETCLDALNLSMAACKHQREVGRVVRILFKTARTRNNKAEQNKTTTILVQYKDRQEQFLIKQRI